MGDFIFLSIPSECSQIFFYNKNIKLIFFKETKEKRGNAVFLLNIFPSTLLLPLGQWRTRSYRMTWFCPGLFFNSGLGAMGSDVFRSDRLSRFLWKLRGCMGCIWLCPYFLCWLNFPSYSLFFSAFRVIANGPDSPSWLWRESSITGSENTNALPSFRHSGQPWSSPHCSFATFQLEQNRKVAAG